MEAQIRLDAPELVKVLRFPPGGDPEICLSAANFEATNWSVSERVTGKAHPAQDWWFPSRVDPATSIYLYFNASGPLNGQPPNRYVLQTVLDARRNPPRFTVRAPVDGELPNFLVYGPIVAYAISSERGFVDIPEGDVPWVAELFPMRAVMNEAGGCTPGRFPVDVNKVLSKDPVLLMSAYRAIYGPLAAQLDELAEQQQGQ